MSGINNRTPAAKHACRFCGRLHANMARLRAHETNTRKVSPIVQSSDGSWQFHPYCATPRQKGSQD